ncbi:DUF551 domain-containing protein [Serratia nevei]|uniref:DUF551 domain-containing protein n=1 Tax=Serratia nevei TaxID=2703794 RepID=UPI003FA6DA4E
MTLTTERLKQLADPNMICKCSWDEYQSMARELLANRESQPAEWSGWACQFPGHMPRLYGDKAIAEINCDYDGGARLLFLSSAPPALPSAQPVAVTDEMALAFHRALNDGGIGESDLEEIKVGLRGALCNITAQHLSGGWVSCSERMPEPNKYVQVSNGVWVGIGMYNDADHFEDDERWQDEYCEFIDLLYSPVTHWMPLPAAPEGGNGA